jgi:hypothetical protein
MSGKCPKCDKEVTTAKLENLELANSNMRIRAFSASCPHCGTTMGVLRDPQPMDVNQ